MSNTGNDQAKIISDLQFVEAVRKWRLNEADRNEQRASGVDFAISKIDGVQKICLTAHELRKIAAEIRAKNERILNEDEAKIAELTAAIDSQQGVDLVLRGTIRELEAELAKEKSEHTQQMKDNNLRFAQFERTLADNVDARCKAEAQLAALRTGTSTGGSEMTKREDIEEFLAWDNQFGWINASTYRTDDMRKDRYQVWQAATAAAQVKINELEQTILELQAKLDAQTCYIPSDFQAEFDRMKAKLDALDQQEPVAHTNNGNLILYTELARNAFLYAQPKPAITDGR